MKRYIISLLISADLVLTFSLACPAWAGLLSFQGWAIEQDQTDDIGYHECNFITLSPDNKHAYAPQYVTVSKDGKCVYIIGRSKTGEKPVLFSVP